MADVGADYELRAVRGVIWISFNKLVACEYRAITWQ